MVEVTLLGVFDPDFLCVGVMNWRYNGALGKLAARRRLFFLWVVTLAGFFDFLEIFFFIFSFFFPQIFVFPRKMLE